jgi:lysophospholipase L1-like esterase
MDNSTEEPSKLIRYVAIGDSFSEGLGDDEASTFPGWTGRLATALAGRSDREVFYANLAIRGRLLDGVLEAQVPAALSLEPAPTLITLSAGGNNMLRPRFDVPGLLSRLAGAARLIRASGAQLVLVSPADPSDRLPMGKLVQGRGNAWAEALKTFSEERSIPFVDVSRDSHLRDAVYWAPDRLHLNALGHQRVADLAAHVVDRADAPAPPELPVASRSALRSELRYYREFVGPWLRRRITGRSSGDGRAATHPDWTRVPNPEV